MPKRRTMLTAAALATLSLMVASRSAGAQKAQPLRVIVFPGGFNWPLFVAQERGYFADNGVAVNITPTPDSKTQMVGLIDGNFDIAMTAMDNVIAYAEGQGAAPTERRPDICAFLGSDNGFLRLVAVPEVKTVGELKGKKVGVDALTTGYAFVLRKLLENGGLQPGEFEFVQAGGVMSRFSALMKKEFAATLLVSPFEAAAARDGFNLLANASEALGAYQGVVAAARRDWAAENAAQVIGFIRAYRAALDWLYTPANQAEAIAILKRNVPNMADPVAAASYEILLESRSGFFKDAALDPHGVAKVLDLRSEYGEPKKPLSNPAKYYDLTYFQAATK